MTVWIGVRPEGKIPFFDERQLAVTDANRTDLRFAPDGVVCRMTRLIPVGAGQYKGNHDLLASMARAAMAS